MMKSKLITFSFMVCVFCVISEKYVPPPRHTSYFKENSVFMSVQNWNSNTLFKKKFQVSDLLLFSRKQLLSLETTSETVPAYGAVT